MLKFTDRSAIKIISSEDLLTEVIGPRLVSINIYCNAEYGEYVTGKKIIGIESKMAMKKALERIQSGDYAKEFILENHAGAPSLLSHRRLTANHPIEKVGEKLRAMMPWISANKLVDQSKN